MRKQVIVLESSFKNDGRPPSCCKLPQTTKLHPAINIGWGAAYLPAKQMVLSTKGYWKEVLSSDKPQPLVGEFAGKTYQQDGNAICRTSGMKDNSILTNATIRIIALNELWYDE